jgi:hypothetical protein
MVELADPPPLRGALGGLALSLPVVYSWSVTAGLLLVAASLGQPQYSVARRFACLAR